MGPIRTIESSSWPHTASTMPYVWGHCSDTSWTPAAPCHGHWPEEPAPEPDALGTFTQELVPHWKKEFCGHREPILSLKYWGEHFLFHAPVRFYEPGDQCIPIPCSLSHIAVSLLAHCSGSMWRTWTSVTGNRQNDEIVREYRPCLGLRWERPSVLHGDLTSQISEPTPLLYLLPLQGTKLPKRTWILL